MDAKKWLLCVLTVWVGERGSPGEACGTRDDRSHQAPHSALLHAGYSQGTRPRKNASFTRFDDEETMGYDRKVAGIW